jgi:uncharacterized protein DUF995
MEMKRIIAAIAAVALTPVLGQSVLEAKPVWTPMNEAAVANLYSGKTWFWAQGAAYFAPDGQFKARARSKGVTSIAEGRWEVRSDGVMCFEATWTPRGATKASAGPVETCFEHQARGSSIAQRKDPDGAWYFFKHAKPRQSDEIRKLARGDHTRL